MLARSKELHKVLERFHKTDTLIMKQNLKNLCKEVGTRKEVSELIGMDIGILQSCLNPAHKTSLTFEHLINICNGLGVEFDDVFKKVEIKKSNRGANTLWNKQNKEKFINLFKKNGIQYMQDKYNITSKTAQYYYDKFQKEIDG